MSSAVKDVLVRSVSRTASGGGSALLGSARGAAVRSGPDLGEPRRGAASFLGCVGVQTEASQERKLWSGWNDGDNLRRLPGGGGRAGGEIFRTLGTHSEVQVKLGHWQENQTWAKGSERECGRCE